MRVRLLFAGSLLLASCAYSKEDGKRLESQVYAQETQLQALQSALNDLQQTTSRQTKEITALSEQVSVLNQKTGRNSADLGADMDTVKQELARLKGLVEGGKDRLDTIESQVNKVSEELDLRFQGLAEKTKIKESANEAEKQAAIEEAKTKERLFADPKGFLEHVVALVNDQKAGEARKLLREFLLRAKDDKKLDRYGGDAQFLIGETYFLEANYQLAATEYNNVRKSYPKSEKIPEALYKMGMCFENLKLPDDAKLFYQTLIKQHPKADATRRAKERLKELK